MSCPICGMPPRDGEPCCTREYAKSVVKQADARISALAARAEKAERELAEARNRADTLRLELDQEEEVHKHAELQWIEDGKKLAQARKLNSRSASLLERLLRGEHELGVPYGPGPHESQIDRMERFEDDCRQLLALLAPKAE